jgi:hypothetical protein
VTGRAEDLSRVVDRIEWSWQHMQNYKARIAAAQVGYHWKKVESTDAKGIRYAEYVIDEAIPLPNDLGLIVGDAIHSLRACLDNLVYALAPSRHIEFPVCNSSDLWSNQKWRIKDLPADAQDLIYDHQPFHAEHADDPEGCPLWVLDRLWNDDKHRAPHLVMGISDMSSITMEPPGWYHAIGWHGGPLEVGTVVTKVWFFPDTEPEVEAEFGFDIAFEPFGPARGRSVYYCLVDLHKEVTAIVQAFAEFFA